MGELVSIEAKLQEARIKAFDKRLERESQERTESGFDEVLYEDGQYADAITEAAAKK